MYLSTLCTGLQYYHDSTGELKPCVQRTMIVVDATEQI